MPHATADSLVEALRGRPILTPKQFDELIRDHAPLHTDNQELARTLIRLRWLTVYQAKKLLAGKPDEHHSDRGFYWRRHHQPDCDELHGLRNEPECAIGNN